MRPARCDMLVVGGGPAGLATAIAGAQRGLGVLVVERDGYAGPRAGEHMPPAARPLIEALGVGDLAGTAAGCPGIRSAWGSGEPADRDYISSPHGEGLSLLRPAFDRRLADRAAQCGAQVLARSGILGIERSGGRWRFVVGGQGNVVEGSAAVLVDATGRAAAIARRLGARPVVYDHLVGLIGRIPVEPAADQRVLIEALQDGWWYATSLADGSLIATFFTDPDLVDASAGGRLAAWRERLQAAPLLRAIVPPLQPAGPVAAPVAVRSARTQCLDTVAADGWIAVGDAAASFDPLSSEGIAKGLAWGMHAARAAHAVVRGDGARHIAGYRRGVRQEFAAYLLARFQYYAAEKRWPDAPFWHRRHVAPQPVVRPFRRPPAAPA